VLDAVLELEVLGRALHMGLERLAERRAVIGMDAAQPFPARVADLVVLVAEHRLPAGREVEPVGVHVPVPQAVIGALERERVTLAGLGEPRELARVAHRALERVGREPAWRQDVAHPGYGEGVVPLPDHYHRHAVLGESLHGLEPDLRVEQDDVGGALGEQRLGGVHRRHGPAVDGQPRRELACRRDDQRVHAASPGGSSAVCSQYSAKTLTSLTSARNVTGLTKYVFAPAS
jgi:hypothetical protein